MSNYINVLRRLERERRTPEAPRTPVEPMPASDAPVRTPPPSAPAAVAAAAALPVPATLDDATAAPRKSPETPSSVPPPAAVPRTVIPLPSAAASAPTPIAAAPTPIATAPTPIAAPPAEPAPRVRPEGHDERRARAFAHEPHPGIATLLENIRMLASGRPSRIVVFCGASNAEAVAALAHDLATYAGNRGMTALVGSLVRTPAGTAVTPAHAPDDAALALPVDLDAGSSPDALHGWADRVAPGHDLVVLTGPPLASSIDAALLACACDGLVIVAESEVTERAALQTAAERARIAGCRTLGVVMHGTKDRMPSWMRRMLGDQPHTPSGRED